MAKCPKCNKEIALFIKPWNLAVYLNRYIFKWTGKLSCPHCATLLKITNKSVILSLIVNIVIVFGGFQLSSIITIHKFNIISPSITEALLNAFPIIILLTFIMWNYINWRKVAKFKIISTEKGIPGT